MLGSICRTYSSPRKKNLFSGEELFFSLDLLLHFGFLSDDPSLFFFYKTKDLLHSHCVWCAYNKLRIAVYFKRKGFSFAADEAIEFLNMNTKKPKKYKTKRRFPKYEFDKINIILYKNRDFLNIMRTVLVSCVGILLFSASIPFAVAAERISTSGLKIDFLAEGMTTSLRFSGTENESYRIRLTSTEDLIYYFGIFDPRKSSPIRSARVYPGNSREIIFTPSVSQEYEFRFSGLYRYGKYRIDMDRISSAISTSVRRISAGQLSSGTIAEGQRIAYQFYGKKYKPLFLNAKSDGNLWFFFRVIDPESNRILAQRWITRSEWTEILFTPQESKLYRLDVLGAYDYGKYSIDINRVPQN
jgi:hypothetical protein